MRPALGLLIVSNAALFLFGAVQHAGIPLGRFHEPTIIPAVIVETRMLSGPVDAASSPRVAAPIGTPGTLAG
jgi:hypothetical protein